MQAGRSATRGWPILVLALCAVAIWGTATRLRRVNPFQLRVPPAVAKNSPNPSSLLAEADGFYSLFNWPAAHPLYQRAEMNFEQLGDRRNAACARIGRLRAESWPVSTLTAANKVVWNSFVRGRCTGS